MTVLKNESQSLTPQKTISGAQPEVVIGLRVTATRPSL